MLFKGLPCHKRKVSVYYVVGNIHVSQHPTGKILQRAVPRAHTETTCSAVTFHVGLRTVWLSVCSACALLVFRVTTFSFAPLGIEMAVHPIADSRFRDLVKTLVDWAAGPWDTMVDIHLTIGFVIGLVATFDQRFRVDNALRERGSGQCCLQWSNS